MDIITNSKSSAGASRKGTVKQIFQNGTSVSAHRLSYEERASGKLIIIIILEYLVVIYSQRIIFLVNSSGWTWGLRVRYKQYTYETAKPKIAATDRRNESTTYSKAKQLKYGPMKTNNSFSNRGDIKSKFKKTIWGIILITCCYTIINLYMFSQRYSCLKDIQLDELQKDLYQQVIAQEEAVNIVLKSIEDLKSRRHNSKLLVFVGSNGVGKTFIAELVASRFPTDFIHTLSYPDKLSSSTISDKDSCCKLIIVDNLKSRHIADLIEFLDSLPSTSHCNLVITIFNIQEFEENFTARIDLAALNVIQETLADTALNYKVIFFNTIKKSVVDSWLLNELDRRNVGLSERDKIIEFVLADSDFVNSGFKRLHERLKLAVKMYDI